MIFKGFRFRRTPAIAFRASTQPEHQDTGYVEFYYPKSGKVIPSDGHSRTNMMYTKDGRVLLAYDGVTFSARL